MSASRRHTALAALLVLLPLTACLPYTVGTSAQTVPANESTRSASSYFAPSAVKLDDSVAAPMFGVDVEWRHGLDATSDVGIRALPGTDRDARPASRRRLRRVEARAASAAAPAMSALAAAGAERSSART